MLIYVKSCSTILDLLVKSPDLAIKQSNSHMRFICVPTSSSLLIRMAFKFFFFKHSFMKYDLLKIKQPKFGLASFSFPTNCLALPLSITNLDVPHQTFYFFFTPFPFILDFKEETTTWSSLTIGLKHTTPLTTIIVNDKSFIFCHLNSTYDYCCNLDIKLNSLSFFNIFLMLIIRVLNFFTYSWTNLSCFNFFNSSFFS